MISVSEFLQLVSIILSKDITCIYKTNQPLSEKDILDLSINNCGVETDNFLDILTASSAGLSKNHIYFDVTCDSQNHLEDVLGKCRLIVSSLDVLSAVNHQVQKFTENGFAEPIAIRVIPDENEIPGDHQGIYLSQITELSSKLRNLDQLTIRGIFINPYLMPYTPSSKLKDYFSTIKNIRSWLPCTFSYFCMEHVTDEFSNIADSTLIDNLDVLCLLNNTSFYSEFLLS